MIASLGMYDFGAVAAANDRYWALIRDGLRQRGLAAPDALTRGDAAYWPAWQAPDLILSQTCGFPFRSRLYENVSYIGTPDYGVEGCPPGYYCSVFVSRRDDPRSRLADFDPASFAYNDVLSQSGWAAPQTHTAEAGLDLSPVLKTGGHRQSARAVAEGRADVAAIDAVTWTMMQKDDPVTGLLKPMDRTMPTPGLPYIAAAGCDPEPAFSAISAAIVALSTFDRATLHLRGVVRIPLAAYLAVPNPPAPDQIVHGA